MDAGIRKAVRQSHTKSRGGCAECKRRRVKCDEKKPSCSTCLRRSKPCIYAPSESARSSITPGRQSPYTHDAADVLLSISGSDSVQSPRNPPSRHSEHFEDRSRQQHSHSHAIDAARFTPEISSYSTAGPFFDLFDLELWNHWPDAIASTIVVFGAAERPFYMKAFLEIALKHVYVARLMLALSAAHLGYLTPSRQPECMQRSAELQSKAIPDLLQTLTEQDPRTHCTPLFLASSLLCWCNFARGPEPGQYLAYSDDGSPEWLGLLDGVRSIVEGRIDCISPGLIPDLRRKKDRVHPEEHLPGYRAAVRALGEHISELELEDPGFSKYLSALELLAECFEGVFERTAEGAVLVNQHHVFRWLYQLHEGYRASLQARRPLALVIFAHYMVLIYQLRHVWVIEGWPEHVMAAVRRHLPLTYLRWIEWPLKQVPLLEKNGSISSPHGGEVS